jgi:hypothetical protein
MDALERRDLVVQVELARRRDRFGHRRRWVGAGFPLGVFRYGPARAQDNLADEHKARDDNRGQAH